MASQTFLTDTSRNNSQQRRRTTDKSGRGCVVVMLRGVLTLSSNPSAGDILFHLFQTEKKCKQNKLIFSRFLLDIVFKQQPST